MNKFARMSVVGVAALSFLSSGITYAVNGRHIPAAVSSDRINVAGDSDRSRDISTKRGTTDKGDASYLNRKAENKITSPRETEREARQATRQNNRQVNRNDRQKRRGHLYKKAEQE